MISGFKAAVAALFFFAAFAPDATAQENPAKRLSSIVSVAIEEYVTAVDSRGKLIARDEYDEAAGFLQDARSAAKSLRGYNAPGTQALLDTLIIAVSKRVPPSDIRLIHARFNEALGSAGAMDVPTAPLDTARGRQLYTQNCSSCHGDKGLGDGAAAAGLPLPVPAIGSKEKTADLTPSFAYNVVSVGVRGTPMPSFASSLSAQDRWNVVNYIYALRGTKMPLPVLPDATSAPGAAAARSVLALLDSALEFARKGRPAEAGAKAFDAYIAFEPLEAPARARQPGLVASMERRFADFKGALRGKDLSIAERARDAIALDLPRVVELTQPTGSSMGAFFQSFLIILREGFEAILVIGAIVAFLIKTGNRNRLGSIWIGIALGVIASALMTVILQTVFARLPTSREVIEGITMLAAVAVLFSVSYWLISKVEAAKWQKFIREKVSTALDHGGGKALAIVAFLAVFREGAETALFYQALFTEGAGALPLALGILVGGAALAVIFTLFYRFGVRIPMRPFFTVTSVLLYYLAFVLMGKGIRELQEGDVIGITVVKGMPSVPSMGIFPSMETLLAQAILLALFLFMIVKTFLPATATDATGT